MPLDNVMQKKLLLIRDLVGIGRSDTVKIIAPVMLTCPDSKGLTHKRKGKMVILRMYSLPGVSQYYCREKQREGGEVCEIKNRQQKRKWNSLLHNNGFWTHQHNKFCYCKPALMKRYPQAAGL